MATVNIEALQKYVDYLNRILNKTITESRLCVFQLDSKLYVTRYQNGFLPLELKPHSYLHFWQRANIQLNNKVNVLECRYIYSLSNNPDDEGNWVFRYEYSLKPATNKPHAHLHINACRNGCNLPRIHFPTARLSVEQIIVHLIVEHSVKSKRGWFKLLAKSHEGWMKKRRRHMLPILTIVRFAMYVKRIAQTVP